jgi:hypothetical protein
MVHYLFPTDLSSHYSRLLHFYLGHVKLVCSIDDFYTRADCTGVATYIMSGGRVSLPFLPEVSLIISCSQRDAYMTS